MTNGEIEGYHEQLRIIVRKTDRRLRSSELQELARTVGAYSPGVLTDGMLDDVQLIFGIRTVLHTASTVNMAKAANRNVWVGLLLAAIAFLGAAVAWVAFLLK